MNVKEQESARSNEPRRDLKVKDSADAKTNEYKSNSPRKEDLN